MSKRDYDLKYQKEQLVGINIRMKPELKEKIDNAAKAAGKSTRAFILDAVMAEIEK